MIGQWEEVDKEDDYYTINRATDVQEDQVLRKRTFTEIEEEDNGDDLANLKMMKKRGEQGRVEVYKKETYTDDQEVAIMKVGFKKRVKK